MDTTPAGGAPKGVSRGLIGTTAVLLALVGITAAGRSYFSSAATMPPLPPTASVAEAPAPAADDGRPSVAVAETERPTREKAADGDVRAEGPAELQLARAVTKFAVAAPSANANATAPAPAGNDNANAIQDVSAAAAQTAQSAELQGAVKSVWRMAWERSWPFIKTTLGKFWNLMVQAWHSLVTLGKTSQPATNAAVNGAVNAATNAP